MKRIAFVSCWLLTLTACVSPRAVLVNPKGEYITCATQSFGVIGSMVAQTQFDNCVADAKSRGYTVERKSE